MTAVLQASIPSAAGVTAVSVALIGAIATSTVGLLNYRNQRQSFRWQREHEAVQTELLRTAQITDRFTRAIAQLESKRAPVQIVEFSRWNGWPRNRSLNARTLSPPLRPSFANDYQPPPFTKAAMFPHCKYERRMHKLP
jgi:hypothetical protein